MKLIEKATVFCDQVWRIPGWRKKAGYIARFTVLPRINFRPRKPEWGGRYWFNLATDTTIIYLPYLFSSRGWYIRSFNAHHREYADGSGQAGYGLLQVGRRHLLYTGFGRAPDAVLPERRLCVGFCWLVGGAP